LDHARVRDVIQVPARCAYAAIQRPEPEVENSLQTGGMRRKCLNIICYAMTFKYTGYDVRHFSRFSTVVSATHVDENALLMFCILMC
jgi:hypothetical protein